MTGVKIITALSATGLLATAVSPIDMWAKVALEAPIVALLWWTIAKTIPKISGDHKEGLSEIAAEVKKNGERTNKLLEKAFNEVTDSGCDI